MGRSSFIMRPTKSHLGRYILLGFGPMILLMSLYLLLKEYIPLLQNQVAGKLIIGLALGYFSIFALFIIPKKQHSLEIKNHAITETNLYGRTITKIKANQIHRVRRNFLDELLLLDNKGTVLLCVGPHLENHILFLEWLSDHDITYLNSI